MAKTSTLSFLSVISVLTLLALTGIKVAYGDGPIRHGATYRIRSGYDGGFLTAKYPKFSEDLTIKLGKAVTEDWEGDPGQIWDAIIWPQPHIEVVENATFLKGKEKNFWLHPKGAALNEITGFRMNISNLLQFVEIADTSGTYLIRNSENGKCLRSQGVDKEVHFETCEDLKTVQQWDLEEFFEDRSAVDKTFIYNSTLHRGHASASRRTNQVPLQEIKHVCRKECHIAVIKI